MSEKALVRGKALNTTITPEIEHIITKAWQAGNLDPATGDYT